MVFCMKELFGWTEHVYLEECIFITAHARPEIGVLSKVPKNIAKYFFNFVVILSSLSG
jgi:hypothetical protein